MVPLNHKQIGSDSFIQSQLQINKGDSLDQICLINNTIKSLPHLKEAFTYFRTASKIGIFSKVWARILICFFLKKMGQSRPLFVYFCPFLITISIIQIEKSIDGVHGIRTYGCRMVGAVETIKLWQPPEEFVCMFPICHGAKFLLQKHFLCS